MQKDAQSDDRPTIIIPAWNEALTIGRSLERLSDGLASHVVVIVACNGCTDGTEGAALAADPRARVISIPQAGKIGAIRAAEAEAGHPRLYLDADTEISGHAAMALIDALSMGAVAARPPQRYEVERASRIVRSFYEVRASLPSIGADLSGVGVYALSREARERFGEFPDVTADDLYAARIVDRSEVTLVECEPVVVHVPRTTASLVRTLARVHRGNRELRAVAPDLAGSTAAQTGSELLRLARQPARWLGIACFVVVTLAGRAASRMPARRWERDETARADAGAPA